VVSVFPIESDFTDAGTGFMAWAWAFVMPARVQPTEASSTIDNAIE
jgi:hypothetical protein